MASSSFLTVHHHLKGPIAGFERGLFCLFGSACFERVNLVGKESMGAARPLPRLLKREVAKACELHPMPFAAQLES